MTKVFYVDGWCKNNGAYYAECGGSYAERGTAPTRLTFAKEQAHTNNEAEYQSLIHLLKSIPTDDKAEIKMDSQLVVNQVNGTWRVKEKRLLPLVDEAKHLLSLRSYTKLLWIRRDEIEAVLGH